jgi:hypothetical protein
MEVGNKMATNGTADALEQPASNVGAVVGTDEPRNPRGKKIVEYLDESLEMKNSLAANVAVLNSDLLLFASHLRRLIEPVLEATPPATGGVGKLMPAIDAHLRICRQVERFSTFIDRLTRPRDVVDKGAGRAKAGGAECSKFSA